MHIFSLLIPKLLAVTCTVTSAVRICKQQMKLLKEIDGSLLSPVNQIFRGIEKFTLRILNLPVILK